MVAANIKPGLGAVFGSEDTESRFILFTNVERVNKSIFKAALSKFSQPQVVAEVVHKCWL